MKLINTISKWKLKTLNGTLILDSFDYMKDHEINKAIAKICNKSQANERDYCNDLNAMYEAEETLNEDQLCLMALRLEAKTVKKGWYFRATARERAEAFLMALRKWEEVQG